MITMVEAKVTFYYDGNINDFLGLFHTYDGSVTGVFQQEASFMDVKVTEVSQIDEDIEEKVIDDIDKIWYNSDYR